MSDDNELPLDAADWRIVYYNIDREMNLEVNVRQGSICYDGLFPVPKHLETPTAIEHWCDQKAAEEVAKFRAKHVA